MSYDTIQRLNDLGLSVVIEKVDRTERYMCRVGPQQESGKTVRAAMFAVVSQAMIHAKDESKKADEKLAELTELREEVCSGE